MIFVIAILQKKRLKTKIGIYVGRELSQTTSTSCVLSTNSHLSYSNSTVTKLRKEKCLDSK